MSTFYEQRVKRLVDVAGAVIGLIGTGPIILLSAIAVRTTMGSPVLFKQPRPGLNEKEFKVIKFRTMKEGNAADEVRITPVGQFLRRSSIDELPQMLNVLRGEMSFVGPRPLANQYLDWYSEEESKRHSVRPGITGLAQIKGRNSLSWEEKFAFDLEYIESVNVLTDFRIILATAVKALKRESIGHRGAGGVEDFDQYRKRQLKAGNLTTKHSSESETHEYH